MCCRTMDLAGCSNFADPSFCAVFIINSHLRIYIQINTDQQSAIFLIVKPLMKLSLTQHTINQL